MLKACGITALWANRTSSTAGSPATACAPLLATIKDRPEDFVVVELDLTGQRTDAVDYVFVQASTPCEADAALADEALAEAADAETSRAVRDPSDEVGEDGPPLLVSTSTPPPTLGLPSTADWLASTMAALRTLMVERHCTRDEVSAAAARLSARELCVLVDSLRTGGASSGEWSSPGLPPLWERACPLGAGLSKERRRLLHVAVRCAYTHLRTCGRPSGEGGEDVAAAVDGHYVFFTRLFGEHVAEALAQWAQCHATNATTRMTAEELAALEQVMTGMGKTVALRRAPPVAKIYTAFPTSLELRDDDSARDDADCGSSDGAGPMRSDKDVRRVFHEIIRRFYPYARCTVADGRIRLAWEGGARSRAGPDCDSPTAGGAGGERGRKRGRAEGGVEGLDGSSGGVGSSPAGAAYMHLVVRKRNLDTMEMRSLLASACGVREGAVCVAGMKDKRAVTYQRVSIPAGGPGSATTTRVVWPSDPLESYLEVLHRSSAAVPVGVAVDSVAAPLPLNAPMQLGQLQGNAFRITLRGVQYAARASEGRQGDEHADGAREGVTPCLAAASSIVADLHARFEQVTRRGFINYFGPQRFSQSAVDLLDHTGLHLFAGRYVAAVRSIFRACPEVYNSFPERMDARYAPRNSRDCQAVAHALRQTYRMCFSEHPLSRQDVEGESALWQRVCERAVCQAVPFALRSIWVHAGQSLLFNVAASYVARALVERSSDSDDGEAHGILAREALAERLCLPTAGYRALTDTTASTAAQRRATSLEEAAELAALAAAAEAHALTVLHLRHEEAFGQRRVAGVPVVGHWRSFLVRPVEASMEALEVRQDSDGTVAEAVMRFSLPPSSYATVCLREILCNEEWW